MKVIKRNGNEVEFSKKNIITAITKANAEVIKKEQLENYQIESIASEIEYYAKSIKRALQIEEIQDKVEELINQKGKFRLAKTYTLYRQKRDMARRANTTDDTILSLIDLSNEEIKQENSNKNPTIVSVQRDYMAGEVSRDLTRRILLPKEIVDILLYNLYNYLYR